MLPNFLCIGAQKSGTTTLLNQLGKHPDIYMSPARETQFFLLDHLYSQGPVYYETHFFHGWDGQKAVGEKTPEYLYDPVIPQRIADTLGSSMRFAATFRSPAQRAYSHYRHNFQQFWEDLGFEEALAREQERSAAGRYQRMRYGYLDRGLYAQQLQRYLALFPRDAFLFLVYERDIVKDQQRSLQRLFSFLGVDADFVPPDGPVSAGRAQPMVPRFIERPERITQEGVSLEAQPGDLLLTRPMMKPRLVKAVSSRTQEFAQSVIRNLPRRTSLDRDEELAINRRHFAEDIRQLERLIGVDLGAWLG